MRASRSPLPFVLLALALSGAPRLAEAYPSYIGYGYTSCLSCHFNALGGGPVTDHGRAVQASTISAKPFYDREATDEELGERSGLFGHARPPRWVRAQGTYRGLFYASQVQSRAQTGWENMEADLSMTLLPARWLWASGTIGGYPTKPSTLYPKHGTISREHYVAVQPMDSLRVYAGLMDVAYGIRIPDHVAYSREDTGLGPASQSHSVLLHWGAGDWEGAVQVLLGNYLRPVDEREKGVSMTLENDFDDRLRLGASFYTSSSESFGRRTMGSVHMRAGVGEGSSVLSELGTVKSSPYFLLQTMSRIARGWNFLLTGEFRTDDLLGPAPRLFRIAPGVLYFPDQRLEFRMDLRATRTIAGPSVDVDGVDLMMQVMMWF